MSPAVSFLVGNLIGAGIVSAIIAATKRWWLVPLPFLALFIIWGIGYAIATS